MGVAISSPYYLTDGQFFMNGSNIVTGDWTNLSAAFANPVATHATPITGYDWTKTFPGSALSGHTVNLTIAHEMHISADVVEDSTTVLSSLTFGTPASIMADTAQPKAMDASWYVCRHVFISTDPAVKQKVDGGAGTSLLPAACQTDLKMSLTKDWGTLDATYMCGALAFDSIPASCVASFGFSRQDVMSFDRTFLANTTVASAQVSSLQQPYSWRIGTQYHSPGSAKAYEMAANRTYLVATVWGYICHSLCSILSYSTDDQLGTSVMLPYAFLLMFLFVGSSMANAAAGKWQLLFFYQVYRYQAAALGVTSSLMAIGCSDPPAVCNLKDFIKYTTTKTRTLPVKDPTTKKPLKDSAGKPLTYISNNWAVVDWDAIGDGDTFDEDKFSSEMDKANFKGGMKNAKIFKTEPQKSFSGVMGEAEKIFVAAAAKLTAYGLPKSNSFSAEVISALDIHADARQADQAILIVENFKNWAKDNGVKEVLGEEIERTGVPTYQLLDAQKTIDQNKLTGDRVALVINFVKKFNAAGQSSSHVTAISTASTLKTKIAKACSGK